jgi:IclR family transcriptional regulator, blcABC operon repressor
MAVPVPSQKAGASVQKSAAPAVLRAASILNELAIGGPSPVRLSDLARRLELPKASVLSVCNALVESGLARRHNGGFELGYKLAELGAAYLAGVDLVREFHDVCAGWTPPLEETAQLAVLGQHNSVTYLARRDGTHPVRLASDVGRSLPASCTATGKAILAQLPQPELNRHNSPHGALPQLTPQSPATFMALRAELDEVRKLGYATDDEQTMEGVFCVAAALPATLGGVDRAAVSFTLLKARMSEGKLTELSTTVRALTAELARRVGRLS